MRCGETTRAMQYLRAYWGPLSPPSLKGLVGEWRWLGGRLRAVPCGWGSCRPVVTPRAGPGLLLPSPTPSRPLLAKPNQEAEGKRARSRHSSAFRGGARTAWSNMQKGSGGTWGTAINRATTEDLGKSWQQQRKTPSPTTAL